MLGLISAHGLGAPAGVPVPGFVFAWGAAIVLVGSFAALGAMWKTPRLEGGGETRVPALPDWAEPLCGAAGIAVLGWLVVAGLTGTQDPDGNNLPQAVYVWFWVGLVPLSLLFGDVFAACNPWRALGRGAGWLGRRVAGGRLRGAPLPYPDRLGRWPAALTIAAFTWVELVYADRDDPRTLAGLVLGYVALQLLGQALYGVEAWTRNGDGFAVYFNLFGRLALLTRRPLLSGATTLEPVAGTIALLCVMLGSTSFDGLSGTTVWRDAEWSPSLGLALMIGLIALVYRLGVAGMRTASAQRFVHSLIPIACAYVIAHYLTFLVERGFETSLDKTVTWFVQVGVLVAGHVGGLVLAHDRALTDFEDPHAARRSQQWMLVVMVGYTSLGLWLLSSLAR